MKRIHSKTNNKDKIKNATSRKQLQHFTCDVLRNYLKSKGISTNGRKDALIDRVYDHLREKRIRTKIIGDIDEIETSRKRLQRFTCNQLQNYLESKGISTEGRKDVLIDRVHDHKTNTSALKEVSDILPDKLEVTKILQLTLKNKSNKLNLLILVEKIEQACFGMNTEDLGNVIDYVLLQFKENEGVETVVATNTSNLRLTTLAKLLRQVDLNQDGGDELYGLSYKIVKMVNENGIEMTSLTKLFINLDKCLKSACADLGRGSILASRLLELGAPILAESNPSVPAMLNLIEELRQKPTVNMDLMGIGSQYSAFMTGWEKWLLRHPGISRYLDPPCVIVEPIGHAIPAIAPIINSLPTFAGGAPLPHTDVGGNNYAGIFVMGSLDEARLFACSMRTHLASPPGAPYPGGVGANHRISVFSTVAAGLTNY